MQGKKQKISMFLNENRKQAVPDAFVHHVHRIEQVRATGAVSDAESRRRSTFHNHRRRVSKPPQVRCAQILATRQRK